MKESPFNSKLKIKNIEVVCLQNAIQITLNFSQPFNGIVYSKGHFATHSCRYIRPNSDQKDFVFTLPISDCGSKTTQTNPHRLTVRNTIVIQKDPIIQETQWDSARKITCEWLGTMERVVTFDPFKTRDPKEISKLQSDLTLQSATNIKTHMEMFQGNNGPFSKPLEGLIGIGDAMTVAIFQNDRGEGYDMLVKNCMAYDSANSNDENVVKVQLSDNNGCLYRPNLMEYFVRTYDTRNSGANLIAFARMNAFKFPDKTDVYLSCQVEFCKGGCHEHCAMENYPIDIIERLDMENSDDDTGETEAFSSLVLNNKMSQNMLNQDQGTKSVEANPFIKVTNMELITTKDAKLRASDPLPAPPPPPPIIHNIRRRRKKYGQRFRTKRNEQSSTENESSVVTKHFSVVSNGEVFSQAQTETDLESTVCFHVAKFSLSVLAGSFILISTGIVAVFIVQKTSLNQRV